MSKDILLYGPIDSYSTQYIIEKIDEELEKNAEASLVVRVNTPGGSPEYTWGIIAKIASLSNQVVIKNDGKAHSAGLFFNCYVEDSECLDTTEFLLHRAAYPSWIENNADFFDEAMRGNLDRINASLRKAFENKVDVKKFEELKGVKLKDVFSMDSRIDVFLTAKEAKAIGLVKRIVKITPEKKAQLDAFEMEVAARTPIEIAANTPDKNLPNIKAMTIEKLKAENPDVYNAIIAKGVEQGIATERDRVGAALAFIDIDKDAVLKIVNDGKVMSQKDMAEFTVKEIAAIKKAALEKEGKETPETGSEQPESTAKTAKEKELAEFKAKAEKELGIGAKA